MNLYKDTLSLIEKSKLTKKQIAETSGVSYRWLFNLMTGEKPDLSVAKVQRVHDVLRAEQDERKTAA